MALDEEACALLPLVLAGSSGAPALRPTEAMAQQILLAILKWARMRYICSYCHPPEDLVCVHLMFYLKRGCPPYPPNSRLPAEMEGMLRRSAGRGAADFGGPQIGPFLWIYGAIHDHSDFTVIRRALEMRRVADALSSADFDALDEQLSQLQGGGPPLLTSKEFLYSCYQKSLMVSSEKLCPRVYRSFQLLHPLHHRHRRCLMHCAIPLAPCSTPPRASASHRAGMELSMLAASSLSRRLLRQPPRQCTAASA